MKTFCIDTNAILDLCYRNYPKDIFANIWDSLEGSVLANQIKIVITEHIQQEMLMQIQSRGYDKSVFDEFIDKFNVEVIEASSYKQALSELQTDLLDMGNFKGASINKNANDFSNIMAIQMVPSGNGAVITGEQGIGKSISDKSYGKRIKLPDVCDYCNIECSNWLIVFRHIGFKS